jgi:hypothetical protein
MARGEGRGEGRGGRQTMAIYRQYLTVDDGDTAAGTASRRVSNIAEIKVQLEQQLKGTIEKTEVQVQLLSAQLEVAPL